LTLYIVPTESLYSLPFEALNNKPSQSANENTNPKTGETAQHYLIEDYPIAYLSSASLLKILRDSQARKKQAPTNQLLAFANPVYSTTQIDENSIEGLKIKGYRSAAGGTFAPLPETADEVKEIQKAVDTGGKKSLLQLQQDASRTSVFNLNNSKSLDDYRYVVFSCHGILPGEVSRLMQPALVLSDPDPQSKENGYLTMADVFGLSFNADLISLSACNTAQGQKLGGEGVMGLTRAFMYAGTPAIAVTLWSVESMSIKELNTGFFQQGKQRNG
ncbi:MAG: CHAT domain-containing protein, partial [Desulfamplus sp.]|nr:CHAT domain-containing protein [Desulfamplus sp.]